MTEATFKTTFLLVHFIVEWINCWLIELSFSLIEGEEISHR